ncbi:hypothetical protein EVAR_44324_1 [Eumeta japonica]|uniref:Uncharacterized protein n=1 Tax=Eumeta variegata TaxID=151549 RepID=A0A4C1XA35_EUMVA|nr:hypothetical protein EVAR_44324_1 [Eumeta japonica]
MRSSHPWGCGARGAGKGRGATTRVALMGAYGYPELRELTTGGTRAACTRAALYQKLYRRARPLDARMTLVANPLVDASNVTTVQMQRPTGLLSSNDDNDTIQIRLEFDQCGRRTKRTSPSAVGCFTSSSGFFSVDPNLCHRRDAPLQCVIHALGTPFLGRTVMTVAILGL